MREMSKTRPEALPFDWDTPSPTLTARLRMALLPVGPSVRCVYVSDTVWVPICVVNYNIHIFPGVPSIFQSLLEGLRPILVAEGRVSAAAMTRVLVSTAMAESEVAPFLEALQLRVRDRGVKIGSYPR